MAEIGHHVHWHYLVQRLVQRISTSDNARALCRSMQWNRSAYIRGRYIISALGLKFPLLPSEKSTLKIWHDLHRLAIADSFRISRRARTYTKNSLFDGRGDDREVQEPLLSDAQRRTIYALSTPTGKAGVAVIRISGPDALEVWRNMVKPYSAAKNAKEYPEPWKMERCRIKDFQTAEILDDGLAVFFKG